MGRAAWVVAVAVQDHGCRAVGMFDDVAEWFAGTDWLHGEVSGRGIRQGEFYQKPWGSFGSGRLVREAFGRRSPGAATVERRSASEP